MNKLVDLNKVIFEGRVYVRVNDLTELFEGVSLYRIKKVINEMELETVKLKGFGGSRFIKETDANKIIIDEQTVMLSTKVRTLNNTIRQVKLMNKMFQPGKEMERQLIEDKINKFIAEEDYIVEEVEEPKAIQENKIVNQKFELENIGFKNVYVGLKTTNGLSGISVLIDKDSNIVSRTSYYYDDYVVANGKFYMDNNETYSGDPEKDYALKLPLQTGSVVVNEDKIIRQLMEFAYNSDYEPDDFGGRLYNNFHLYDDDVYDLQHKDTMFCGIKY